VRQSIRTLRQTNVAGQCFIKRVAADTARSDACPTARIRSRGASQALRLDYRIGGAPIDQTPAFDACASWPLVC